MKKLQVGLKALIDPTNSEFWTGLVGGTAYLVDALGWVSMDKFIPIANTLLTYAGCRVTSKVVKF